ncbi:MAG TPA: hypothetical protein VFT74_19880 [Isosphaeraceae bacterium]|nr:hypothetical protein [Isosphaeraceae bacterium]
MHIHHPKMADRWEKHTPKGKLPKKVDEMPHVEFGDDDVIDLQIEKYPIPDAEKKRLERAYYQGKGLTARMADGRIFIISKDGIRRTDHNTGDARLPDYWMKYVKATDVPKMTQVFRSKHDAT